MKPIFNSFSHVSKRLQINKTKWLELNSVAYPSFILPLLMLLWLGLPSQQAIGATSYVPLQLVQLNKDINHLFLLTDSLSMQRPYAISHVQKVVNAYAEQYPILTTDIQQALNRLTNRKIGQAAIKLKASSQHDMVTVMPNQLGERSDSIGSFWASGSQAVNSWLTVSYGINANQSFENVNWYESYFSLGGDALQLDIGYKQDWLSPFQTRSMLYSNNAKTTFSVGLKNPVPFANWWDLQYNVFVKSLEQHDAVVVGDTVTSGTPYVLTTQLSIQPFAGTSIAFNRTFQFGGRGKDISLEQIWGAFTDAVGNDNGGLIPSCGDSRLEQISCEFGNQRASLTVKQNFGLFSVYGEFAGEDAASGSNLFLGDLAVSAGVYIPRFNVGLQQYSLVYEVTEHQSAWHRHHIYKKGYRVNDISLGHWGTNYTFGTEGASGLSQALTLDTKFAGYHVTVNYLFHRNKKSPNQASLNYDYVDHHDLAIKAAEDSYSGLQYQVGFQRNVYDEKTVRASIKWVY